MSQSVDSIFGMSSRNGLVSRLISNVSIQEPRVSQQSDIIITIREMSQSVDSIFGMSSRNGLVSRLISNVSIQEPRVSQQSDFDCANTFHNDVDR